MGNWTRYLSNGVVNLKFMDKKSGEAKMKNVLIVVIGNTGSEAEALRQSLEAFGYFVAIKYIGRPNDFLSVLKGELIFEPDCLILSCHGDEGEIVMPVLGESVYESDEPRGNLTASDIDNYLKLQGKLILNKILILRQTIMWKEVQHCTLQYPCFMSFRKKEHDWRTHLK